MRALLAGVGITATVFGFTLLLLSLEWGWWGWVMLSGAGLLVVDSWFDERVWRRVEAQRGPRRPAPLDPDYYTGGAS